MATLTRKDGHMVDKDGNRYSKRFVQVEWAKTPPVTDAKQVLKTVGVNRYEVRWVRVSPS